MRTASIIVLSAALLAAAAGAGAADKAACVECHRGVKTGVVEAHNFGDWKRSAHARAGVSCEACHGGDAAAKDKASAHKGVLRSSDPASAIYFTRIPGTCGACHSAELAAFRQSAHFKELESSGKGPNCVTCHGSMANVVLGPRELEHTCMLCHRQPTQAFAARMQLDVTASMVAGLAAELRRAKAAGAMDLPSQEKAYREIVALQREAAVTWHTFKLADVIADDREIKRRVTALLGELRLKNPRPE